MINRLPVIFALLVSGLGIGQPESSIIETSPVREVNTAAVHHPAFLLTIMVVDASTGEPVQGALVTLNGGSSRLTDPNGRVAWDGLAYDEYQVAVEHAGYEPVNRFISYSATEADSMIRVALNPKPVLLEEIEVTGRRPLGSVRERFETRRRMGRGDFILPEVFDERRYEPLSQVIARHSGLQRLCSLSVCRLISRRASVRAGSCRIQFYIDGVFFALPEPNDHIDLFVPTNDVRMAEVYLGPSQIPAEYNRHDGVCGVVLIWTRHGS